jgi:hypothetical protein
MPFVGWKILPSLTAAQEEHSRPAPPPVSTSLSKDDDLFLEELEKATFNYFWEQASPETGLVKDRCDVRAKDHSVVASIAATGFGLTALCIGEKHRFIFFPKRAHVCWLHCAFYGKNYLSTEDSFITSPI